MTHEERTPLRLEERLRPSWGTQLKRRALELGLAAVLSLVSAHQAYAQKGTVVLSDKAGAPAIVNVSELGGNPRSTIDFDMTGKDQLTYTFSGTGPELTTGALLVKANGATLDFPHFAAGGKNFSYTSTLVLSASNGSVSGQLTFTGFRDGEPIGSAPVFPAPRRNSMSLPIVHDDTNATYTGVALYNPTDKAVDYLLTLYDDKGTFLEDVVYQLPAQGQVATFPFQLFTKVPKHGSLQINTSHKSSAVAITQVKNTFGAVSVTEGTKPIRYALVTLKDLYHKLTNATNADLTLAPPVTNGTLTITSGSKLLTYKLSEDGTNELATTDGTFQPLNGTITTAINAPGYLKVEKTDTYPRKPQTLPLASYDGFNPAFRYRTWIEHTNFVPANDQPWTIWLDNKDMTIDDAEQPAIGSDTEMKQMHETFTNDMLPTLPWFATNKPIFKFGTPPTNYTPYTANIHKNPLLPRMASVAGAVDRKAYTVTAILCNYLPGTPAVAISTELPFIWGEEDNQIVYADFVKMNMTLPKTVVVGTGPRAFSATTDDLRNILYKSLITPGAEIKLVGSDLFNFDSYKLVYK